MFLMTLLTVHDISTKLKPKFLLMGRHVIHEIFRKHRVRFD